MARREAEPTRSAPRLYLIAAPARGDENGLGAAIRAAGHRVDIAAVLLRRPAGAAFEPAPLLAAAHEISAACLAEGDVGALKQGFDGVHLDGIAALQAAIGAVHPHGIAGVGGLRTRHDAMTAGELGADYVMFGEPDSAGRRAAFDAVLERIEWWAQLFEPPCVGYAETLAEADALIGAGADFIAVGALLLDDPEGVGPALAGRLAGAERS
ncbi:thiamine phosphate synthase [Bosea sp. 117]|uniref:thiamine phosphate synthase n=1 Tax=Bosea sp. 117 TaxID=1125973 RepID=UPI000493E04A|nr:thiamine phosphate synthase [Bosea sp. 117]